MDDDLDMSDSWRVLHSFGIPCAHRAQLHVKRALSPCFLPYTAVKIDINIQLDMANGSRGLVSGS